MSLQVWLPLTKDLRQQGLSDVTVTNNGATFDSTGKLGGCYSFNGSNNYIKGNYIATETMSFACWVYLPAVITGKHVFDARTSGAAGYQPIYLTASTIQIGNSGTGYTNFNYTWVANTWYHICVTHDSTQGKCYINGELIGTSTNAKGYANGSCNFTLGSRCNQSNYSNVKLNDVRIYDHCLSPMEVKELSKGLVLHYPLNRQGWGQENLLLTNSNPTTTSLTGWGANGGSNFVLSNVSSSSASGGRAIRVTYTGTSKIPGGIYKLLGTDPTTLESGANYTVSARLRASKNCQLTLYNETMSGVADINVTTKWKTFSYTAPVNYGGTYSANIIGIPSTQVSQNMWVECDWTKFEKGDKATPWCPNASESLYTLLGLNSNIEYDASGFNNNGTRIGTFSWTSNTPKYKVSQVFNGTDNAIQTPNLTTMITDKNYTIACWTYKTVIGTKNYQTIYGGPSGFELEARSSSSTSPLYRIHNWGGGSTPYNFGEWTHFCFVHTDSDSKLYVNGKLKITGTSANIPSGNYFVGAWNTSTSQNYEGLMSDFRIYATALSANEVKALYQNEAYVDSNGVALGPIH